MERRRRHRVPRDRDRRSPTPPPWSSGATSRGTWATGCRLARRARLLAGSVAGASGASRCSWRSSARPRRCLAERLGLGPGVQRALRQVYERWDGGGAPDGAAGTAISRAQRVVAVAHDAVVLARLRGPSEAARHDPAAARAAPTIPTSATRCRRTRPRWTAGVDDDAWVRGRRGRAATRAAGRGGRARAHGAGDRGLRRPEGAVPGRPLPGGGARSRRPRPRGWASARRPRATCAWRACCTTSGASASRRARGQRAGPLSSRGAGARPPAPLSQRAGARARRAVRAPRRAARRRTTSGSTARATTAASPPRRSRRRGARRSPPRTRTTP